MASRMFVVTVVVACGIAAGGSALLKAWQDSPQQTSPPPFQVPGVKSADTTPPPGDGNEFKISSEVELVLLDVSVKGADGGFVSGLKKEDFHIYDSKIDQPIRIFAAQDAPVTVGLVVDNSGSVRPKKPEIVTAALTFVTQSNPHDEVFIVNFSDAASLALPPETPFTSDRAILRTALLSNPAQGRTALNDALKMALEHLDKGRLDKKTLVLVSDGGDNASDVTKDEIVKLAEHSLATIYTIGIFDADDRDKNPGFLRELAKITGGEAFIPENKDHLVGICEKIARDIRSRYTLGFAPSDIPGAKPGKPRPLRVTAIDPTSGKKLDVRTRTQYFPHNHSRPRTEAASK